MSVRVSLNHVTEDVLFYLILLYILIFYFNFQNNFSPNRLIPNAHIFMWS